MRYCLGSVYVAGSDPTRWIGADKLLQSELDVLRPLVSGGRSRSPVRTRRGCCLLECVRVLLRAWVFEGWQNLRL